jgi:hypothetical protein
MTETPEWRSIVRPWQRLTPAAMWLVDKVRPRMLVELGTHMGDSYFSFCQAIRRAEINTKAFAVDTWEGEEHSKKYGENVYEAVSSHNQSKYGGFSTLLRMKFDEAVCMFDDCSIDLLHIDGLHTYKAVQHDFQTWLPKLSQHCIVLFHDCTEIQKTFGVWRFWHQINTRHPSFTFHHSHGLGIIAWGQQMPREIAPLFSPDPILIAVTRHLFENIGECVFNGKKLPIGDQVNPTDSELLALSEDICRIKPRSYARQWACYIRAIARSHRLWPI